MTESFNYLGALEAEAIHILREAAAQFRKPALLYSMGEDSTVLLHLARKAFWPAQLPFPLLHVDTTWEFREMIEFRERLAQRGDVKIITHINKIGLEQGINPFDYSPSIYTQVMKTEALKQALAANGFDAAIGGARRDEEASRAKERIFSFRSKGYQWDPRHQRPEMWNLMNGRLGVGETVRVFPLSNWAERDVWFYIAREQLDVVPLYFASLRPTLIRDGQILVIDGPGMILRPDEEIQLRKVRFRTLGCWPNTAAEISDASTVEELLSDLLQSKSSERRGRLIDHDEIGAMEAKKREGYF